MEVKCEAHSNLNGVEFHENIEGVDEWPHSWPDKELSYRLNNFSEDFNKRWQTRAVTIAFRVWQLRLSKLKPRRERNPDVKVDIDISWKDLDHFDGKKGTLAHAIMPGQGETSGDCHINDEWNYVAGTKFQSLSRPPLVPILVHEFGHSLGLRHDGDISSIMYPSFNLGLQKYKLGPRDVSRIQERYAGRTLPQRVYDMFANRRLMGYDFR